MSWGGGELPALSANNVQMGRIDFNKECYTASEALYRKWMIQGDCESGDVLLPMEAPLGNVAQVPDSRKYILSQRVLLIRPRNWLKRSYLAHFMSGPYFQALLTSNSTGSTAKGIQRQKLDQLPAFFPASNSEQQAIIEALSDADALIEALEQLIAKKRQIKQGAMQQLLTGRKRLPGFTEEWETIQLAQKAEFFKGVGLPKSALSESGRYQCIHYGELFTQ
jgi:type I restriction enzyme S subunit